MGHGTRKNPLNGADLDKVHNKVTKCSMADVINITKTKRNDGQIDQK